METRTDNPRMAPAMALALQASFGSVENWRREFAVIAHAAAGSAGWVRLSFQPREGKLVHQVTADPAQAAMGGVPILAWQAPRDPQGQGSDADGRAVDDFIDRIGWEAVYERYQAAVEHASEALAVAADEIGDAQLLDVRRAGVFEQAEGMIPGARWRDPGEVGSWSAGVPRGTPVVVYCVYGHEVGRATAMRLHAAGVQARFLRGGIDGWTASGRPVAVKEPGTLAAD